MYKRQYLCRNAVISGDNEQKGLDENLPPGQLLPISGNRSRSVQAAFSARQKFTEYFTSVGSVLWQEESVSQGHY